MRAAARPPVAAASADDDPVQVVRRCVERCPDPAGKKERILIARELGVITGAQATAWLILYGLEAA